MDRAVALLSVTSGRSRRVATMQILFISVSLTLLLHLRADIRSPAKQKGLNLGWRGGLLHFQYYRARFKSPGPRGDLDRVPLPRGVKFKTAFITVKNTFLSTSAHLTLIMAPLLCAAIMRLKIPNSCSRQSRREQ